MKRRDFVIKGSLASLALTTSTSMLGNLGSFKAANDVVNIGVIGTGSRGSGLIPFINEIEGLNVVACCDILPFRLQEGLRRTKGKAEGYSDYRRLLDNRDVDAVLVATPFHTHSEIDMDALDAGKHVYGEKTLAKGNGEIRNLLVKAKHSKNIFQTGHQLHSSRLYSHVVELIRSGKIGEIEVFECQYNRNTSWRRPVPSPELEKIINWRMYREFSGGLLAELSAHQIDFANWVMDSTPVQVMGTGGLDFWKDGREIYDNIHVIYSYSNGVEAKFTSLGTNAMDGYQIKVKGSKGTIILGFSNAWFYPEGNQEKVRGVVDGVSGATIQWEKGKGIPIELGHADPSRQALMDFRDSIANNKQPISNIVTGANTAICVQMGLEAMYNNEIVKWPSEFDSLLKSI
ncbi:Gfo/Idh/MocA family protein [Autumnicola edwardsiae]|uniref:Gfo/Idh/MocA family oxidoreductase n=1 Tax=Autumnicola edwardsiae TaxID=3075594 RepID=A0ABU3CWG4_9FLAO|nr:Gfo/Idh/MocA family oxidoreductase [Zunongwangia sp. F297]MDT0650641.1 Gfo/Idh/MocA family oxidoreductase [Zunongwangia sp. F297]